MKATVTIIRVTVEFSEKNEIFYAINQKICPILTLETNKIYLFDVWAPGCPFFITSQPSEMGQKVRFFCDSMEQGKFTLQFKEPITLCYFSSKLPQMSGKINVVERQRRKRSNAFLGSYGDKILDNKYPME